MRNIHKDILNSKKYDLVIYDTPPTLGLADSLLISDFLDGTILVVSINKVDRSLPKETIQRIKSAPNINLLGLITNSTNSQGNSKRSGYGNYGYGYNKNYGYNNYSYIDSYSNNELEEEEKLSVDKNKSLPTNSKIKSNFIDFISQSIKKFKVSSNKFLSWLDN